ncbi:MAG TPA: hypothetical protein VMR18_02395 [Candidatus Saccharimonadales bacterium]|nr:hypothetical protein [Candidatus Saccharimonadales bacterium]
MSSGVIEGLSPSDTYQVASVVGNQEHKLFVYGLMVPGVPYTVTPLHTAFMELQGDDPAWVVHKNVPHEFCATFSLAQLVVEQRVGNRNFLGYTVEEERRKLVLPFIGHLGELSLFNDPSLLDYFGPTATNSESGIRPSERRIKLMNVLRQTEGKRTRVSDLSAPLEVSVSVAGLISDDLATSRIISKESSGRGKPAVTFTPNAGLQTTEFSQSNASQILFDTVAVLQEHFRKYPDSEVSNEDIASQLVESYGYDMPNNTLHRKINSVTVYLGMKKVITPKRKIEGDNARGVVWATDGQLEVINQVLEIVGGLQKPDDSYIASGLDKIDTIIDEPDFVKHLVLKAKRDSIGVKGNEDEQQRIRTSIGEIAGNASPPLTLRAIQEILLDSGDKIDRATIHGHLEYLQLLGAVSLTETDQGHKYGKV